MRFFAVALLLVLLAMQYRLWVSDDGVRSVFGLKRSVAAQKLENAALARRNGELAAEVKDLKEGLAAIEERARTDIGMVGANETFFQVVDGDARAPIEPAPRERLPIQRTSH
ncbi:MAG TPA: cell division protein FtsB [Steroidobacteraceae bacterium]|nr:cell division protein FtsB [Steroidobacteraceae bacterium]